MENLDVIDNFADEDSFEILDNDNDDDYVDDIGEENNYDADEETIKFVTKMINEFRSELDIIKLNPDTFDNKIFDDYTSMVNDYDFIIKENKILKFQVELLKMDIDACEVKCSELVIKQLIDQEKDQSTNVFKPWGNGEREMEYFYGRGREKDKISPLCKHYFVKSTCKRCIDDNNETSISDNINDGFKPWEKEKYEAMLRYDRNGTSTIDKIQNANIASKSHKSLSDSIMRCNHSEISVSNDGTDVCMNASKLQSEDISVKSHRIKITNANKNPSCDKDIDAETETCHTVDKSLHYQFAYNDLKRITEKIDKLSENPALYVIEDIKCDLKLVLNKYYDTITNYAILRNIVDGIVDVLDHNLICQTNKDEILIHDNIVDDEIDLSLLGYKPDEIKFHNNDHTPHTFDTFSLNETEEYLALEEKLNDIKNRIDKLKEDSTDNIENIYNNLCEVQTSHEALIIKYKYFYTMIGEILYVIYDK